MNNILLIGSLAIVTLYSIIRLIKKVDYRTCILFILFNISFIGSILILIFFRSTHKDVIELFVFGSIGFLILIFFINHVFIKLKKDSIQILLRTSINSLLISSVLIFLTLYVIKNINVGYQLQLLYIGIGIVAFVLLQLLFKKIKLGNKLISILELGSASPLNLNRIYTLGTSILLILFLITVGGTSSNGNLDDSELLNYHLDPVVIADFSIKSEANLINYESPTLFQGFFSSSYFYSILEYEDGKIILKAYDFADKTETVLLEVIHQPDIYQHEYINLIASMENDIYINTHIGLYCLEGKTLTTLYEYHPDTDEVQFIDYYSMLYRGEYTDPITDLTSYKYILQTKDKAYIVDGTTLIDITNHYSLNFPDESEFYNLKRKFGFSWDGTAFYCYELSNNSIIEIRASGCCYDNKLVSTDNLTDELSSFKEHYTSNLLYYYEYGYVSLSTNNLVMNDDLILVSLDDNPHESDLVTFLMYDKFYYEYLIDDFFYIVGPSNNRLFLTQFDDDNYQLMNFEISSLSLNTYSSRCLNQVDFFGFIIFLLPLVRKEDSAK